MTGVAAAVVTAILIGALYVGREVFIPIALAILLSFVLAPLVGLLQRAHIPRVLSVISVVLFAFTSIFALGGVIATQVAELAGDLPRYEFTMREKIKSLRGSAAPSATLERAADVLQDLGKELNKPTEPTTSPTTRLRTPPPGQETKPIPVEVRPPPPTALENIAALISPLLRPLTTTGITAIFVIFILLQREDLRNRFLKLAGSHDLQKTTAALDDAATRLSRLFLIQLALNIAFGVVIGLGLWAIGIPSPVLWGILAAVLRFVPYIGAVISAVFPLALAAAVDPGWWMLVWTAALFLVVEPLVGHVLEPLLYGHSTGLSPVAVVASATFWTALWGPVGLVLATPLTVCLVVLGRHVERFAFLDVMLSDRPPLSPSELFYQRMLAEDPAEAVNKAEEFLKERPLSTYYDEVAMPGLKLAQKDIVRGTLDRAQSEKIKGAVVELVDDLADHDDRKPVNETTHDAEATAAVETTVDASPDLPVLGMGRFAAAGRCGPRPSRRGCRPHARTAARKARAWCAGRGRGRGRRDHHFSSRHDRRHHGVCVLPRRQQPRPYALHHSPDAPQTAQRPNPSWMLDGGCGCGNASRHGKGRCRRDQPPGRGQTLPRSSRGRENFTARSQRATCRCERRMIRSSTWLAATMCAVPWKLSEARLACTK
jgi:predicted PurR-regulated permease PerM